MSQVALSSPVVETASSSWSLLTLLSADFDAHTHGERWLETLCFSSGWHALVLHRFAHMLHKWGIPLVPRFISHCGRWLTGIEIHPGARLGKGTYLGGVGVVIGETTIAGDSCSVYQGVTLGGTGKESGKRHPTLGDRVVVEPGALVLGNITLGDRARIQAGSVVLRDVPQGVTVSGIPARILPPIDVQFQQLVARIERLEAQLPQLQRRNAETGSRGVSSVSG